MVCNQCCLFATPLWGENFILYPVWKYSQDRQQLNKDLSSSCEFYCCNTVVKLSLKRGLFGWFFLGMGMKERNITRISVIQYLRDVVEHIFKHLSPNQCFLAFKVEAGNVLFTIVQKWLNTAQMTKLSEYALYLSFEPAKNQQNLHIAEKRTFSS